MDELSDDGVVVEGRNDSAVLIGLPGGLVEQGVGADQAEHLAEVAAQADGDRRDQLGELLGVRDRRPPADQSESQMVERMPFAQVGLCRLPRAMPA